MNKKLPITLVPLLAIAALAVTPVAAQAGELELGRCIKKAVAGGEGYSNSGCTLAVGSNAKYEWLPGPGPKNKFTSTEGLSTFETVGGTKIVCKADTDKGEYTGLTTDTETFTFTGCETAGIPCHSSGQPEGTIVTASLTSVLGFINKAKKQVGVSLEGPGGLFAEFSCGGIPVVISGSVIVKVPVNRMLSTLTEKFVASKGKQKPEKFEGEPKDTLACAVAGGETEQCGFTSTDTITNEEKIEIRVLPPAPKWWVAGKLLVGAEAIAEETTVPVPFELAMTGKDIVEPFTIQCKNVKIKSGNIEAPSSRTEQAVVYENCAVIGKPTCTVANTETKPLKASLEGPLGAEKLKFVPQAGTEIATYHVTGCGVEGFYKANGEMVCGYPNVEAELAEHSLEFTATSGSKVKYQFNGKPMETAAKFTGTDTVHLASGKLWSAF